MTEVELSPPPHHPHSYLRRANERPVQGVPEEHVVLSVAWS